MNLDSAIFYTNDIKKIRDFYEHTIGLAFEYQDGEQFVSFLFPNGARLGIKKFRREREKPGYQTVFIAVKDIQEYYKKFIKAGFPMYEDYKEHTWGKYFAILDPDLNKVGFVEKK